MVVIFNKAILVYLEGDQVNSNDVNCRIGHNLASFPGLHAQLLSLAVRKAGEGLDGFIT